MPKYAQQAPKFGRLFPTLANDITDMIIIDFTF